MTDSIMRWLRDLELDKYVELFIDNDIDLTALPHITDDDLKELGIKLGARRKIIAAIANLPEPGVETPVEQAKAPLSLAERRQLTVLFCDLVGSTALSGRIDPEDMRDVLRRYQDAVAGVVSRHDGFVANYLGDGVLAYFGWPKAHEDQAAQAVRAGLAAVRAVATIAAPDGAALAARVGIASGQVVVGDLEGETARQADAISGETPNLAARLQALAGPGEVVIGGQTRDLVGRQFDLADLGPQALKGIAGPVQAWRATGEAAVGSRFAARGADLAGFVGREHELGLLAERWRSACAGEGQVVLLSGEAGIGKSRLTEELRQRLGREGAVRLTYQCAPQFANSAFWPVTRQLQRAAGFVANDGAEARLDKLEAVVGGDREAAQLLAELLSLPAEERYGVLDLAPEARKQRTIQALVGQLLTLAETHPVLFLFEDAHWIDPSSEELLGETVARITEASVMMVVTHRPEWQAPWLGQSQVTTLSLSRLDRAQAAEIVAAIAGPQVRPEVIERIVARTDGVPLFVEELTKALVERGLDAADTDIPATLQASLAARLDRLEPAAREISQIGAVIGRRFPVSLVASVLSKDAVELAMHTDALLVSGLVQRQGAGDEAVLVFKHALVQDTAYESLLLRRRRELHRKIADIMLDMDKTAAGYAPEVLAHHLSLAGDVLSAARQWLVAAHNAISTAAHREAIAYLERALQGLASAPAGGDRDGLELDVQIAMASAFIAAEGYAAEGTRRAYAMGRRIMRRTAFDGRHTAILYGLFVSNWNLRRFKRAETYAKQLVELANEQDNNEARCVGHRSLAVAYNPMARFAEALEQATRAFEFYDPDAHKNSAYRYGHDIGVAALCHVAVAQVHLGHFKEAEATGQRAISLADEIAHPNTTAYAHCWFGLLHVVSGVAPRAIEIGRKLISFTHEHGLAFFLAWGHWIEGAGCAMAGAGPEAALTSLRYGVPPINFFKPYEADALRQLGRAEEGRQLIEAALAHGAQIGEHWAEPELYRVLAVILGAGTAGNEALHRALVCAREQGSAFAELRAAKNLAIRYRNVGNSELAREQVALVVGRFPSGLSTPELIEARSLLNELA